MIFFLSPKITLEEGLVYYTVNIFGSQSRNFNYLMMKKVLWYLMIGKNHQIGIENIWVKQSLL